MDNFSDKNEDSNCNDTEEISVSHDTVSPENSTYGLTPIAIANGGGGGVGIVTSSFHIE